MNTQTLLKKLREGGELSLRERIRLPLLLSLPAMLAQLSTIIMQYIDASMVGSLGADESAAIGLVSTSTWIFGGLSSAAAAGFTVLVSHRIGAGRVKEARNLVKLALIFTVAFSLALTALGGAISSGLPRWLGGDESILSDASGYFFIYIMSLPFLQLNNVAAGMLQCSGNMKVPGIMQVLMCALDVLFNALLIFPTCERSFLGLRFVLPGAGMGVRGAALGTALAHAVVGAALLWFMAARSGELSFRRGEKLYYCREDVVSAVRMALPVAFERVVMGGAQVMSTRIVAPLGSMSIAANSFAVTAESLCYMPGYGVAAAATTLVGQSFGAGRKKLARELAWISTAIGAGVMAVTGALMYLFSYEMIGMLSPVEEIRLLGSSALRVEAIAEPLFGASIVISGALRGEGDTLVPSIMNLVSMWLIRIPASALLSVRLGLRGVWTAMSCELCVRGIMFIIRLASKSGKADDVKGARA